KPAAPAAPAEGGRSALGERLLLVLGAVALAAAVAFVVVSGPRPRGLPTLPSATAAPSATAIPSAAPSTSTSATPTPTAKPSAVAKPVQKGNPVTASGRPAPAPAEPRSASTAEKPAPHAPGRLFGVERDGERHR